MRNLVLVINPGSTSTKLAIYREEQLLVEESIGHSIEDLRKFNTIYDQLNYRLDCIVDFFKSNNIAFEDLEAVVSRGGMLRPIPSGVYLVTDLMREDLLAGVGGDHASNLGGVLAREISDRLEINSYIVDPVSVDEFKEISRVSGLREIERKSQLHALNIRAVAYKYAAHKGCHLDSLNLIVAHLGGGISICAMENGSMVDVNNANEMGPFSPERTGTLPVGSLVELCYSDQYDYKNLNKMLKGHGGLMSYLETNDGRIIEEKINSGDIYAKLIYDAMIYQIGKEIGSMAAVLEGRVDSIVLTGGLSYSDYIVSCLKKQVGFISDIQIYPGENEMESLNKGYIRIKEAIEEVKNYDEVIM